MASRLSKFLSQRLDMHIDCPALTLIIKAPHLVHDLIPRQHDSLVDDKVFETTLPGALLMLTAQSAWY